MTLEYSLCKKLKDAGFPQKTEWMLRKYSLNERPVRLLQQEDGTGLALLCGELEWEVAQPTLSELIDACGEEFVALSPYHGLKKWGAHSEKKEFKGRTKEEAVAHLYLKLNSND